VFFLDSLYSEQFHAKLLRELDPEYTLEELRNTNSSSTFEQLAVKCISAAEMFTHMVMNASLSHFTPTDGFAASVLDMLRKMDRN